MIVVSQKVVSKAEGRIRRLAAVEPGERADELAAALGKDPRIVELVLSESRRIVRASGTVLIAETHGGWICANAGIDFSNVPGAETATLLPRDADASARLIRGQLAAACGTRPAVVVADSFGRPWRVGQADVAIGCAGLVALDDWRGRRDALGDELAATAIAVADELAAAADLAREKADADPGGPDPRSRAVADGGRRTRGRGGPPALGRRGSVPLDRARAAYVRCSAACSLSIIGGAAAPSSVNSGGR